MLEQTWNLLIYKTDRIYGQIIKNRDYVEASSSSWVNGSNPYFVRGGKGGIFSFSYDNDRNSYYARGVVVCGAGLLYRMKYLLIFRIRRENFKEFFEYYLYIKET